jgi:hypothetical protein
VKLESRVSRKSAIPMSQLNSRWLVGAGEEDAAHMQEDRSHHGVRGPPVHVAQNDAEGHGAAQIEHAPVSLRRGRNVIKHQ